MTEEDVDGPDERPAGRAAGRAATVQSVDRAVELLEHLANLGGTARLSDLSAAAKLPLPTIHRLLRTLAVHGYVLQGPSRAYTLGPRLIRLGDAAERRVGAWASRHLTDLVDQIGETANLAMLDGDAAVYLAQAPSPHAMRMFTEVGRRVPVHSTGVGKALLSQLSDADVESLVARTGLPARTPRTLTTAAALTAELMRIRRAGYAVDAEEQEVGVRCVAVPVGAAPPHLAISVSGPSGRMTPEREPAVALVLQQAAAALLADLHGQGTVLGV